MTSCVERIACRPVPCIRELMRTVAGRTRDISGCALIILSLTLIVGMCSCSQSPGDIARKEIYVRDISEGLHDTLPVRGIPGPLSLHRDGDTYECTMCHDSFNEEGHDAALEGEHADISFDHGRNVRCLNCHNPISPDSYIGWGDVEIASDQPTELCSKCHGPHYREWSLGVHGRLNYYWNASMGDQVRRDCIQCHDPHKPRFDLMIPEPPPVMTRFDLQVQEKSDHE